MGTVWRAVDAGRAVWVARRLAAPQEPPEVAALVPSGFGAYVRVRHAGSPGGLPVEQLAALCDVLAGHTSAATCTFDPGEGWPGWPDVEGADPARAPGTHAGARRLLTAQLEDAVPLAFCDRPGRWWARSPVAFWPDDRAWYVATPADLGVTLVGGSVALREDLVAASDLDAWPTLPADPARG